MAKRDKGRLAPFVPMLKDTLDSQAWKHMSFGARALYVALKRLAPPGRNVAYLSTRNAAEQLGYKSRRKIIEWFRELEHYGFIALAQHGSLGVDGHGQAPQWRLTELGVPGGELPSRDYLRWDGVLFEPKRRLNDTSYRAPRGVDPVVNLVMETTSVPPKRFPTLVPTSVPPRLKSGTHVGTTSGDHVGTRVEPTSVPGFCFSPEWKT